MIRLSLSVAAALAAFLLATPATAAQTTVVTSVNVVRPVALSKLQDMHFGTLSFAGFTGTRTITLSRAGVIGCATDIVCTGTGKQARFNITGTNKMTVLVTYRVDEALSNGVDTIPLTIDGPASFTMTNSGSPGTDFDVGGSLQVTSALVGGEYKGKMTITADYQ